MKREDWTVGPNGLRPAGPKGSCLYCGQKLGEQHKEDCVIRRKTVMVDFTIQLMIPVPEFWDENQINYHYNDGTWCAGNLVNYLEDVVANTGFCICERTSAKFVRDATEDDEEAFGWNTVAEQES